MISKAARVSDYLRQAPEGYRPLLRRLRRLIRRAAPDARELMKYGHPHYDLAGSLFALAAQKHYVALYVAEPGVVAARAGDLDGLSVGKSCIRLKPAGEAPEAALARILTEAADVRRRGAGQRARRRLAASR
jgi:uncharacterized protein YdhG (YjbR/CyaY superfamily)